MFKDNTQYYTLTDIINTAISKSLQSNKKKESNELSLHIINDMTYSNIWNTFVKWCIDQSEMRYLLHVYPLGTMYYVVEKQFEGISMRISDIFLKENDIKWDDSKFYYEKMPDLKFNASNAQVQKLNLLTIASELNLPKVYVQNGLNNLFKAIGILLSSSPSCLIDMGFLGNLHCTNKHVYHIPTKLKKDAIFRKKATIKTILGKYIEETNTSKDAKANVNSSNQEEKQPQHLELNNEDQMMKSYDKSSFEKMRFSMNKKKEKTEKITNEKQLKNNLKKSRDKVILVPIREQEWQLKEMLNSTFKLSEKTRGLKNLPTLFNAYSNTKAAPFTSEKTQIPIAHRIASFYSIPLQNFIIDKTTKCIKRLYDDYFYKYKNVVFEIPATEDEEYLFLTGDYSDKKKIELRRSTYKLYKNFISNTVIPDECISEIKESWLVGIVKMCLRAYNLNNQERYNDLLNACIREIIMSYKDSMRKSILDYLLKHPELREKLSIPVGFRKLKEYAQDTVNRPNDGNLDWKRNWNLSKLRISNNLMIVCENITKILKYYVKNLNNKSYLDLNERDWTGGLKLTTFIDNQKAQIEDQRAFVSENWKKYVETVLKENKIYKDQLILYFKAVSGLMSSQLRNLIIYSLEKYYKFIQFYRKPNNGYSSASKVFMDQFNPILGFERSFIEVEIIASPDGVSFCFSDELSDIHNKLLGLTDEIVKCSQDVERPDNMFIKNLEKRTHLWEVPINDFEVSIMKNEIDMTIKENLDVVNKVLELYQPFVFVLQEKANLEKFKQSHPKREEIKKAISFYEDKLKVLREDMPNSLYLNMIKMDCTQINKSLREMLYGYIVELLDHVRSRNINAKSKELCERIEKLKGELNIHAQDEESLAQLEANLELYRHEQIPQLNSEYFDLLEWLFFYLNYDTYPIFPEGGKETLSGGMDIHTYTKNVYSSVKMIEPSLDNFTSSLKDKRVLLEGNLNKTRGKVNTTITNLKKRVDNEKENIQQNFVSDEAFNNFLVTLQSLKKEAQDATLELQSLKKKEELLGDYATEDDRIELCQSDLEPMINYFSFYCDYKTIQFDFEFEIRQVNFPPYLALIEKATDLFDISIQKIPILKGRIAKVKAEFEYFKIAVELGKFIFSINKILNNDNLAEDSPALFDDNNYYCKELYKTIFPDKDSNKAQDNLKNLKFKEILNNRSMLDKFKINYKLDVDKIVQEWESVEKMYDILAKIANEVDIDLKTENFKDKKFIVVSHEIFTTVKNLLNKNIKEIEQNMNTVENSKEKVKILIRVADYKTKLGELLDIMQKFENVQLLLENYMSKSNILQKKSTDLFVKLKQAEKDFKILVDFIVDKPHIMNVLSVKEFFRDTIYSISKILNEIPLNTEDNPIEG